MTDDQRATIKRMLTAGKPQTQVAEAVGLCPSTIGKYALRHRLGRRGPRKGKRPGAKHAKRR